MLAQQQSEVPARSDMVQLQDSMRSVEASLQRLQTVQAAADGRWQTAEAAVARLETAEGLEQQVSKQVQTAQDTPPCCCFTPIAASSLVSSHLLLQCCSGWTTPMQKAFRCQQSCSCSHVSRNAKLLHCGDV